MLNLKKEELVPEAKNRKINEYKCMSKDELISAIDRSKPINNNKKEDKKSLFKSKIEEVQKILHDSKIKRDRKITEIHSL